jgi:hypothetical protein
MRKATGNPQRKRKLVNANTRKKRQQLAVKNGKIVTALLKEA